VARTVVVDWNLDVGIYLDFGVWSLEFVSHDRSPPIHPHPRRREQNVRRFKAINDLNFYMDEGELRVIIGPNGAGKSTMLDIITGRTRPDKARSNLAGTLI